MKKCCILFFLVFAIVLSGCTNSSNDMGDSETLSQQTGDLEEDANEVVQDEPEDEEIDYEKVKPNENGQVMILMYHGIDEEEAEFVRTPENFRKDLKTLYDKGYRLISLGDYIENNIKVEAGYTPVILTFDDGLQNQFNMIEDDKGYIIDPDCAVGILEDFCEEYPDFGKAASFFVYYPTPFRQKELIEEKFKFLVDNGYEIGNHGYSHENLGKVSIDDVQKSLALNTMKTKEVLKDYNVQALALPYGAAPKGDNYKYVVSGEHDGVSYHNKAILRVGSNPALSPNHVNYDPTRLPRVRASEMLVEGTGLYDYLKYFDKNPEKRYISDGDANTITIPEKELDNFDMDRLEGKKFITYSL